MSSNVITKPPSIIGAHDAENLRPSATLENDRARLYGVSKIF